MKKEIEEWMKIKYCTEGIFDRPCVVSESTVRPTPDGIYDHDYTISIKTREMIEMRTFAYLDDCLGKHGFSITDWEVYTDDDMLEISIYVDRVGK